MTTATKRNPSKPRKASSKETRLEARVTSEQKELISQAAAVSGHSLTSFIVNAAYESALTTLREHQVIKLAREDSARFAQAMINPRSSSAKLTQVGRRYAEAFAD